MSNRVTVRDVSTRKVLLHLEVDPADTESRCMAGGDMQRVFISMQLNMLYGYDMISLYELIPDMCMTHYDHVSNVL